MTDTRNIADVIALPDFYPGNPGGSFLSRRFIAQCSSTNDSEEAGLLCSQLLVQPNPATISPEPNLKPNPIP